MNGSFKQTTDSLSAALTGNETIAQLAQRHLKDKSHTTTDEELRNAKIELSSIERVTKENLFSIKSFIINNSK